MRGIPGGGFVRRLLTEIVMTRSFPVTRRTRALQRLGMKHLESAYISPGVYFSDLGGVIGSGGCFINTQMFFDRGPVHIGAKVMLAARVMVLTTSHEIGGPEERGGRGIHGPVRIGDGSWVGAGAIILPGVTIGEGCVIGAGAVVTRDCEPHGLYVGAPARRVRDLACADE